MGADFNYQIVPLFKMTDKRKAILNQRIETIDNDNHELITSGYLEDALEAKKESLRVINNYPNMEYYRDIGTLHLHDCLYILSGGMSWGDDPTDSFRDLCILAEIPDFWILGEKWSKEDWKK